MMFKESCGLHNTCLGNPFPLDEGFTPVVNGVWFKRHCRTNGLGGSALLAERVNPHPEYRGHGPTDSINRTNKRVRGHGNGEEELSRQQHEEHAKNKKNP